MKTFTVMVVGLVLSAGSAFGFDASRAGHYVGGGQWKSPDGTTGKYTSHMTVKKTKTGVAVSEELVILMADGTKHTEKYEWTAEPKRNGFFDVLVNKKAVGYGYCYRAQCHISMDDGKSKSEETFILGKDRMIRTGSDVSAKHTVAWQGTLRRK